MMYAKSYLKLAEQLANNPDDEAALQPIIATLPVLDQPLLETLAIESEKAGDYRPKTGWAIARIANLAANQQPDNLWLQTLSAWYLARAANRWVRPNLVYPALHQARNGFKQLNEYGWLAACDWQSTELAWVRGDVVQAVQKLKKATATLNETKLRNFAIQSRLSYASTRLYVNEIDEAKADLVHCVEYFSLKEDDFGLAQCALLEGVIFRSQNQLENARKKLNYAIEIFTRLQKIPFLARAYYQTGVLLLFTTTDIPQTVSNLEKADELFTQCDLGIWRGTCQSHLGLTVLQDGQLEKAECCFAEATSIYHHFHTPHLSANNYNASGLFHLAKGNPQKSITEFQKAKRIHELAGELTNVSIDTVNLGKAYFALGRYQDALHFLEKAKESAGLNKYPVSVADCEYATADAWFSLGNLPIALKHLSAAEKIYSTHNQNGSLTTALNLKANIYFESNEPEKAITCLEESLERSLTFHLRSQAALAHRLIGQLLTRQGDFSRAYDHLKTSSSSFTKMQMGYEKAISLLALGDYYIANGNMEEAIQCVKAAMEQSSMVFDEINWHAYANLALISENSGNLIEALSNYQQSIHFLTKIRVNFWQAEIAGSYANRPSEMFFHAISLAVNLKSSENVFAFIEADKAGSLTRQLTLPINSSRSETSRELEDIKGEITWLQDQIRASSTQQNGLKSAVLTRQYRQTLIEKSKKYEELNSAWQRKNGARKGYHQSEVLTPSNVQAEIQARLGNNWIAVDYYFQAEKLFLFLLTPERWISLQCRVSARARLALEACQRSQQNGQVPDSSDLQVLGNLLIPTEISKLLQSDTLLILSPHSQLHGLPWNALLIGKDNRPLVEQAVPVLVPSLRSALALWSHSTKSQEISRQPGLVVGVSQFMEKYPSLPAIEEELRTFETLSSNGGKILRNEAASWPALLQLAQSDLKKGLARFNFFHLASHFFSDSISGQLSGVALWGETIYQDQLRALAPLPELVTLSGCSSIFSRTYAGDEHIGLPTTCLMAGAESVIGSNWPIHDESAAEFMKLFYRHYQSGLSPAIALAQTQREFIRAQKETASWAGYSCIGKP